MSALTELPLERGEIGNHQAKNGIKCCGVSINRGKKDREFLSDVVTSVERGG